MLPAVSAELPAYLIPPTTSSTTKTAAGRQLSDPAFVVELSSDSARAAQSRKPGTGLYGPNGRFVETASQNHAKQQSPHTTQSAPDTTSLPPPPESTAQTQVPRDRQLSISQIDAAVPPAGRDELQELARKVEQNSTGQSLDARQYKEIANLMDRVGRYDQAQDARNKAAQLENGGSSSAGHTAT